MAQLIGEIAVAIPLHLPLVDGQHVPVVAGVRDDVAFPDLLFQMGARDRHVFVVGVVGLRLLFDGWLPSHGRPESERSNHCAHY